MRGRDRKGVCPLHGLTLCCLSYDDITYECLLPLHLHYLLNIRQTSSPAYAWFGATADLRKAFLEMMSTFLPHVLPGLSGV